MGNSFFEDPMVILEDLWQLGFEERSLAIEKKKE
jgi:hypothetical protein